MLHHIVLIKYRRRYDQGIHRRMKKFCRDVVKEIPGAVSCHYGENAAEKYTAPHAGKGHSQGFTHTLISVFKSTKAHDIYQQAAFHQELRPHLRKQMKEFVVCDYQSR